MENRSRELYIPVNTMDSEDYISGIGSREVAVISLISFIAIILGILISMLLNVLLAVSLVALILSMTIMVIRRDLSNENLIKKMRVVLEFVNCQKKYEYRYSNIYEGEDET